MQTFWYFSQGFHGRQRPDLRRDCDPMLMNKSLTRSWRQRPDLRRDCDRDIARKFHLDRGRQRPDLRRDCDAHTSSRILPPHPFPTTKTWFTKGLRPATCSIILDFPATTKTWFTKGLRLCQSFNYNGVFVDDKDLIYEGIATQHLVFKIFFHFHVLTTKTWFTKGLRRSLVPKSLLNIDLRRQRPDLRRDCDRESVGWSWLYRADDKDLIYEGIATNCSLVHYQDRSRSSDDKDLIYEGIATILLVEIVS